ncbi:Cysteine/serine-rich nuclear protein 3 [Fasciola gigantica]|uniref:Cysteine/serine-rich nuclear protein 3 n=1 Tax=Fasciola gigantica TaxID=46835 RepID=A0A504YMI8_FASGI|nr:Cysteine/serine-rich nuclear protein 3 [Fasciola gigantica]
MTDLLISPTQLKKRHCVSFSKVEVYYFDRAQGFICVPSQGGSTLGMKAAHWAVEEFSVNSHQYLRLLERYLFILKKYRSGKLILGPEQVEFLEKSIKSAPEVIRRRVFGCWSRQIVTTFDGVVAPPPPSVLEPVEQPSSSDARNDADCSQSRLNSLPIVRRSIFCDDLIAEEDERISSVLDCYFLPLLSIKKRRILLRRSGIRTVDPTERIECQAIRLSRDICGCSCTDGVCLPDQCQCALNGIKCQMDRLSFPCPCTGASACENPQGRVEFNPIRVRTHYLHTRMRLEMEQQSQTTSIQDKKVDEPLIKRQRLNESILSQTDSHSVKLAPSENFTEGMTTEFTNGLWAQPMESLLNSTTANGGCRDCEDDRYVHLMQKFVTEINDQSFGMNPSETPEPTVPEACPNSNDLMAPDDVRNNDSALQLVSPVTETFCDDGRVIADGHPGETYTAELVDPLLYATPQLTDVVEIFPFLPGTAPEAFETPTCLGSFENAASSALNLPIFNGLEHADRDEPSTKFTLPLPMFEQSELLVPDESRETSSSHGAVKQCTLEPISSLFASCTTSVTAGSLVVSELPISPAVPEEEPSYQVRETNEPQTSDPVNSDSVRLPNIISLSPSINENGAVDDVSCNFSNLGTDTEITGTNADKLVQSSPNSCSETEDSHRNSNTPSSSRYLEIVKA